MNKKEVLEIRKQFTPENCTISRICGCYVDGEKNIKFQSKDAFLSLQEEEAFKYFTIFKQSLSGTIGKNLLPMEFPLASEMPDGAQHALLKLRDSRLQDDALVDDFYQKVIEHYDFGENYYIILIHAAYDIPGKSTDGMEMFDASDNVYEYLLCSICPVHLSKEGLCYNPENNVIETRLRDWIVEPPAKGFLFPAFTDRNTDLHNVLYYSKNPEDLQPNLIEHLLGCNLPMSVKNQRETFHAILTDTMGDECSYETVKTIHENLNEMIEEHKDEPEPLVLSKPDVKRLLEKSGVSEEKMENFESSYAAAGEDTTLLATNIAQTKKFSIETPDVVIKINSERTDLIRTQVIDGVPCFVISASDSIEINGVNVRMDNFES